MEIELFIKNISSVFEETDSKEFCKETEFKSIEEYSSLIALSIIAMIDEEYGVTLKGEDIRNSNTIEQLYKIVESRK